MFCSKESNQKKIKKILVIEDQSFIRHLIKIVLDFDHYEIHEASDTETGMKMAYVIKPDLILLDIMLPPLLEITQPEIRNGIDLCRSLKNNFIYAHIPIILLTAKGRVSDIEIGFAAGANDYLIKPFTFIGLINVVEKYLTYEVVI